MNVTQHKWQKGLPEATDIVGSSEDALKTLSRQQEVKLVTEKIVDFLVLEDHFLAEMFQCFTKPCYTLLN